MADTATPGLEDTIELPVVWVDGTNPEEPAEFAGVGLDGPVCGTALAHTHIRVIYDIRGELFMKDKYFCCHRHVPDKFEDVPGEADMIELSIADGVNRTRITFLDGNVEVTTAPEEVTRALLALDAAA